MQPPRTRVTVSLLEGRFDEELAEAPRDELGRVYNELWVHREPGDHRLTISQTPTSLPGRDSLLYRLDNWSGTHPVYRWVSAAD